MERIIDMKKMLLLLCLMLTASLANATAPPSGYTGFNKVHVSSHALVSGNLTIEGTLAYEGIQIVTVSASTTTSITATASYLIIKNAETIGTHNVVLPTSPVNGRLVVISPASAVTTATVTAGAVTVRNGPTALVAGTPIAFIYSSAETAWFRSR